jgi:hypothetical protein
MGRIGQERVDPLPDSAIRAFRQSILPFAVRRRGIEPNLPPSWWIELVDTVVYLKLRAPASILQKKTPFEILCSQ